MSQPIPTKDGLIFGRHERLIRSPRVHVNLEIG